MHAVIWNYVNLCFNWFTCITAYILQNYISAVYFYFYALYFVLLFPQVLCVADLHLHNSVV